MNIDIEIEEGDNLGHVLNEVAQQVAKESDADVVTLQLALPPTASLRGTPIWGWGSSEGTTFRDVIGTIEFAKQKMVENH